MGSNFTIRYRLLDLKSNPEFKDQPAAYKDALRNWYNYYYRLNSKPTEVKIPKILVPNQVLVGLFSYDEVDNRLGNYLASILENHADKKILVQIAADHVNKAVRRIDDINDVKKVMLTIGTLWGPIQLRAVTEVLKIGRANSGNDRILFTAWFNGCVMPALRVSHYNDANAFSRQDIQALYDVCYVNTWVNLKVEEAI